MFTFIKIRVLLFFLLFYCESINSFDVNRYCELESKCVIDEIITSSLHIGCPKNYANSPSLYNLIKLKSVDRELIANELNQFRSDIALQLYSKIFPYRLSDMQKIQWNHELEYLTRLMITKVPNTNFHCMVTDTSVKPLQLFVSLDRPQPFNLHKVMMLALNELKSKALTSFRNANVGDIVNWSQIYDPNTWAIGCAVGEFTSINVNDKFLLRCAFYGTKHVKRNETDDFSRSFQCSNFGKFDSELFPGLCEKDQSGIMKMKGDKGEPGDVGPQGEDGVKGENGKIGNNGPPGLPGITGEKGERGVFGIPGDIGLIGSKGEPGDAGEPGICEKGLPGIPGRPGIMGLPGKPGDYGEKGKRGEKGEKLNSTILQGESGLSVTGAKGSSGKIGEPGEIGLRGEQGDKGVKGEKGVFMYEGDKCITCPPKQGKQGPIGPPGPKGEAGTYEVRNEKRIIQITTPKYEFVWL